MPLWLVYHPTNTFTSPSSKQALAQSITNIYVARGLPAFYVSVNFIPVEPNSQFVGGEPHQKTHGDKPFIRISIDHIAIKQPDNDSAYAGATDRIDRALKPHIADKGYDWEYHVTETERRLWKVNGLVPPPWKSDAEQVWRDQGYPVVLDGMTRPWMQDSNDHKSIVTTSNKPKRGGLVLSDEVVVSQREISQSELDSGA